MDNTTITVSKDTAKRLHIYKWNNGYKTIEAVILDLLKKRGGKI